MLGIIGKKIGMSCLFDKRGERVPCSVIKSDSCSVVQIKNEGKDGYKAVQLGFGEKKEKNTSKPIIGHYKKANCKVKQFLYEIKNFEKEVKEGSTLILSDLFQEGDFIDVVGLSKGKGFQGVVKRHGFSGVGGQTHGQHNRMRHPGSVGASSFPSRVFKGERMAGRMGGDRVTVKKLKVLKILQDKNIIVVKGCIPGCNNSFVVLQK
jgi:large subunit ribosomal protein L3